MIECTSTEANFSMRLEKIAPVVRADEFRVRYDSVEALSGVSLSINGRGIHALIGPSGCGKSTFLLAVAGLLQVSAPERKISLSGRLEVQPECLAERPSRLRSIGMVFQKPLPFRMSIFENLAVVLKEHSVAKDERSERIECALRDVGLWNEVKHCLNRSAFALSGGQQQRLCLARTLVLNPCLLLLDEPCSSLDPLSTARIEETLLELAHERCLVLVTHNLGQAKRLAKDVSLFWRQERGAICAESSSASSFFERPSSAVGKRYLESEWGRLI